MVLLWSRPWKKAYTFLGMSSYNKHTEPKRVLKYGTPNPVGELGSTWVYGVSRRLGPTRLLMKGLRVSHSGCCDWHPPDQGSSIRV